MEVANPNAIPQMKQKPWHLNSYQAYVNQVWQVELTFAMRKKKYTLKSFKHLPFVLKKFRVP